MRSVKCAVGGIAILATLAACGGGGPDGPTYADYDKGKATTQKICETLIKGDDMKVFAPKASDGAMLSVVADGTDRIDCEIQADGERAGRLRFSSEDGSGSGDLVSYQGSLYGWTVPSTTYPEKAQ